MQKIKIERYDNPEAVGYQGYVEPEDRSWILYIELDGTPLFYAHRAEDGGVMCEGVGPHNVPRIDRGEAAALAPEDVEALGRSIWWREIEPGVWEHSRSRWRATDSWELAGLRFQAKMLRAREAAVLGHCPRCEDSGASAGLVAVMSDDGSCFEAEGCLKCGASWWINPPKPCAPAGAATVRYSEFSARANR